MRMDRMISNGTENGTIWNGKLLRREPTANGQEEEPAAPQQLSSIAPNSAY